MNSSRASVTRTGTRSSSNKRPVLPSRGTPDAPTSSQSQQQQLKTVHRPPSPPLKVSSKRAKLNDHSHSHVKHSHLGPSPGQGKGPNVVNKSERSVMNVINVSMIPSSNVNMNGNYSHAHVGFVDSNGNGMSSRTSEPSDLSSSGTNNVSRSSLKKELSNSSTVTSLSTSTSNSSSSASDVSSTTTIAPTSSISSQSGKSNTNGATEAVKRGKNQQNTKSEYQNEAVVPATVRSSSQGHPNINLAAYSHSQPQLPARCLPNTIRIVQVGERHWMCDICRAAVFENFVEACMHEMSCKQRTCAAAPGASVAATVTAAPVSGTLPGTSSSNLPFPSYPAAPMQVPPHFQVPAMFQPLQSMQFGFSQAAAGAAAHGRVQPLMHPMMQQPNSIAGSGTSMPIGYPAAALVRSPSAGGNGIAAPGAATHPKSEALNVSLVPEKMSMLSDYNYILSNNIEFFETVTTYTGIDTDSLPASKVGLRCIHCASGQRRITAASFFPSSKASISSGIGTIGSRHFIGGKCPFLPKNTLDALRASKKSSPQQTRTAGRVGLDAYCRELAKTHKIFDHEFGGIYFVANNSTTSATETSTAGSDATVDIKMSDVGKKLDSTTTKGGAKPTNTTNNIDCSKTSSSNTTANSISTKVAPVLMVTRGGRKSSTASKTNTTSKPPAAISKEEVFDRKDPRAFIESELENFWECKYCKSLPFQWRASGSVVFCADTPSIELVGKHLSICQGKKPLRIPRNATVRLKKPREENRVQVKEEILSSNNSGGNVEDTTMRSTTSSQSFVPTVIVSWDNDEGKRKSGRILEAKICKKKRSKSVVPVVTDTSTNTNLPLKVGVENESLAVPEDKSLTTDFAYFTVLQMKKCYLAKAGGSRGNCPVGYPGLACAYCTGSTGERKFFYTSADHLRNSFSHVPSHLLTCSKCPADVKKKIEAYKALRSKQKSQLKGGDHKLFIDKVWTRLHGPGGGVIVASSPEESYETSDNRGNDDDDRSMKSIEVDFNYQPDEYVTQSLDGRYLENKKISIETHQSPILTNSERKLVTDYVYYSILQMVPKQYKVDSEGTLTEMHEKVKTSSSASTIKKKAVTAASALPDTKKVEDSSKLDQVTRNNSCTIATASITCDKQSNTVNTMIDDALTPIISNVATSSTRATSGIMDVKAILQDKTNSQGLKIQEEKATDKIKEFEATKKDEGEDHADEEEEEEDEILQTLVCKHCMNANMDAEFLPESAEDLRLSFAEIPKHLMSCPHVPVDVKNKLETVKAFRAVQEAMLKRGSHKKFVNKVWKKVDNYFASENESLIDEPLFSSLDKMNNAEFTSEVLATTLLSEKDQRLVSEFTFFTMKQMEPCVLENSGNGARSMFSFGFPGLGCKHCSGRPSARKFFYRTPDILSGNYAHIPNHVMVCKHAPAEIKQTLAAKKKLHAEQKQKLQRGSQRTFFSNVWTRLHVRKSIREGKV
eukprot:CAMPEP_0194109834 /NCGR_PEP_ID=MMETSP0150-20130528/9248_1 /TAXON_ID=122233 /ORGANISM="Chaetoceros debilis, Strain MM31A-1" /LENGTH=1455 /DNA_ID=CAMNT_0038798877 /DNA_START=3220 /DNA_END=7587 /DNA_ORIENTATION=+